VSGLRYAVGFLTRVPVGDPGNIRFGRAARWFPIVGALIGLAVGAVYALVSWGAPPMVAAGVAVAFGVVLTGALHHDGAADVADAFGGGATRGARLAILDDPRDGTYGVLALVLLVVIQVASLAAHGSVLGLATLVAAHSLGRMGAVALMRWTPPARPTGLGASAASGLVDADVVVAIGLAVVIAVIALGPGAPIALGLTVVVGLTVRRLAVRSIEGVNGDVLGAVEQLIETAVLVLGSIMVRHDALSWWR
jgi:adenosylcobinamide-GDP ribazoletransferase